jgi:hypothetical protein
MTKHKETEKTEEQKWDEYYAERDAERNARGAKEDAEIVDYH